MRTVTIHAWKIQSDQPKNGSPVLPLQLRNFQVDRAREPMPMTLSQMTLSQMTLSQIRLSQT